MGLMDKLRGELIDIIEWLDDSRDTIVWRFPRYQNEIKMGAKLVVRESQTAVFVNEGQIADAYPPGTYTLETRNMPILSTLKGWKYGFNSPFKAEVYFVNTRQFTDMKWGTQNPVILRDAEFGVVRVRAFGAFSARVVDAQRLLRELVGTDPQFRTEEVQEYLRQIMVGRLGGALATAGVPLLDLAAHQDAIGRRLAGVLTEELAELGIAIPKFVIENISVPPEVERALDKRSSMGAVGDLNRFTQYQAATAIEEAAKNPGGEAGAGVGLGMGMALGQQMTQAMAANARPAQPAAAPAQPAAVPGQPGGAEPPPLPNPAQWYIGVAGQRQGPYDLGGLAAQVSAGALGPDTLTWRAGMAQWQPARELPELAAVLASVPPPLPPQ